MAHSRVPISTPHTSVSHRQVLKELMAPFPVSFDFPIQPTISPTFRLDNRKHLVPALHNSSATFYNLPDSSYNLIIFRSHITLSVDASEHSRDHVVCHVSKTSSSLHYSERSRKDLNISPATSEKWINLLHQDWCNFPSLSLLSFLCRHKRVQDNRTAAMAVYMTKPRKRFIWDLAKIEFGIIAIFIQDEEKFEPFEDRKTCC